jgi:poly(3-hydroxybutyrate) depolymerase
LDLADSLKAVWSGTAVGSVPLGRVNVMDPREDGATAGRAGTSRSLLTQGGHDRQYLLHIPPTQAGDRLPLLVELHGRGIDAAGFDRMTGFRALADTEGFVLAMPSALGKVWNDGRGPWVDPDGPDEVGVDEAALGVRMRSG